MIIKEVATINDKFRVIIQSGRYEEIILNIMNASNKVFPNKYKHVKSQANGECDFIDLITSQKYDAKLLFTKKQGQLVGSNKADYEKWIRTMLHEVGEFGDYIQNRGQIEIESLELYKIMNDRLATVALDEDVIYFIPYTIVLDGEGMIFTQFASDILSTIYTALENSGLIYNRKVYAIYPCLENKIAVRCLNTNIREYFSNNELKEYIDYNISINKE